MYAICIKDYDEHGVSATAFWTTRYMNTDNYSYDKPDATLFASKSAARALIKTLSLDSDHFIEEI